MRLSRLRSTLAALALFALPAGLAVGVSGASAADPLPNTGVTSLSSQHFQIFYSRDPADSVCPTRNITQEEAGDLLQMAERAYDFYNTWEYPYTPFSGPLIHISVDEFDKALPACITDGSIDPAVPLSPDGSLSSWDALISPVAPGGTDEIHLDGNAGRGLGYHTIARQIFYLFGRVMNPAAWDPSPANNQWLAGASAEWAAFRTEGFATVAPADLAGSTGRSLDCTGTECGVTEADNNGYSGWLLVEYLAERFGNDAVKEVWTQPWASALTQLSNVLATHGTTLPTFFNDYAAARVAGEFTTTALAGALPPTDGSPIAVPQASGSIPGAALSVNHLAAAYVKVTHGGSPASACYEAKLTLTVAIPSGVASTPYFYANTIGATAQPFVVSGSTALLVVPWNTCADSPAAYVALPNTSLGLDAREFVLNGSVSVDKTKPATPFQAPTQVPIGTPVTIVPTSDPAPKLSLHAPEILRVPAGTGLLRLIVFASGGGKLQATLGSTALGSRNVHAGNNDVRFVLPKQLLKTLRAKSSNGLLTLTSVSAGGTKGMTLTRRVVVQNPPKPKPKRRR
jgi:hypothetical protein